MSTFTDNQIHPAIAEWLRDFIRSVVAEVRIEKDAWADRDRAEHCGL